MYLWTLPFHHSLSNFAADVSLSLNSYIIHLLPSPLNFGARTFITHFVFSLIAELNRVWRKNIYRAGMFISTKVSSSCILLLSKSWTTYMSSIKRVKASLLSLDS